MNKKFDSAELDAEMLTRLGGAITDIETVFASFPILTADEIRSMAKMGGRSIPFCSKTVTVLAQNKDVLPLSFSLAELQQKFAMREALAEQILRLRELLARGEDELTALGSEILAASLEGYALMKMFGKTEGLEELRQAMTVRRPPNHRKPTPTPV